jgi:hypothetical protein
MADRLIENQSPVIPQYQPKDRYPLERHWAQKSVNVPPE